MLWKHGTISIVASYRIEKPQDFKGTIFGITPLDELQRAICLRERSSVINTRCCNEYNGIAVEKSICLRGSLHLRLLACFSREELLKITYYVFFLTLNIKYLLKKKKTSSVFRLRAIGHCAKTPSWEKLLSFINKRNSSSDKTNWNRFFFSIGLHGSSHCLVLIYWCKSVPDNVMMAN